MQFLLVIHISAGVATLLSAAVAIFSAKGKKIHDKRQDKINLKYQIYIDQKKIYKTSSDKDEKKEAMNILLTHFLKKTE